MSQYHPAKPEEESEGLNLVMNRAKSPVEYKPYPSGSHSSQPIGLLSTTTADANFAKIAPLLNPQIKMGLSSHHLGNNAKPDVLMTASTPVKLEHHEDGRQQYAVHSVMAPSPRMQMHRAEKDGNNGFPLASPRGNPESARFEMAGKHPEELAASGSYSGKYGGYPMQVSLLNCFMNGKAINLIFSGSFSLVL